MSAATSPGTGLAYGLRRVCAAWGMARSSFYAMTSGQHAEQPPAKRRGPKPAISDQALLVAIEADLEASPWEGEGYRKVWARLRVCRDIRVARKRVLRLTREQSALAPSLPPLAASGLSRHPGCPLACLQARRPLRRPASGLLVRLMRENRRQSALAPSLPPPWRQSP